MRYSFFDAHVDLRAYEVVRSGTRVAIQRRSFEVLAYLLLHRDRAVSRGELLRQCWPDAVVSDGSLTTCIKELRRALGDDSQGRVIRTAHRFGYRFVAPVVEASANAELAPVQEGLIGREQALSAVRRGLTSARAGSGTLLRITGEPGIGKTALCREALRLASEAPLLVLHAAASDIQGAPSLWVWIQLVRDLIDRVDRAQLGQGVGPHGPELCELVPELAEVLGDGARASALGVTERRFRLLDALVQLLLRLAKERPIAVVLDDLHWADPTSLQVFELLSKVLAQASLCVLFVHRPVSSKNAAFQRTLAELGRAGVAEEIALARLSDAEARALVVRTVNAQLPETQLSPLLACGQGNPWYLIELARLFVSAPDACTALPDGVLSVVERRLLLLTQAQVEVVCAAAVVGSPLDPEVLASVCERAPDEVRATLADAEAQHLVRHAQGRTGVYEFAHRLVRDSVYELTPPAVRCALHRRAADCIERVFGHAPGQRRALSYHLDGCGDARRAASLALEAASEAYAVGAHDSAVEIATRALATHSAQLGSEQRARLTMENARALAAAGAPFVEVQRLYYQALGLGAHHLAPEAFAETALEATGYGALSATSRRHGYCAPAEIEVVEQALSNLPERSVWRPLVMSWLANLLFRSPRCAEADAMSDEAVRLARALGEPRIVCATLVARAATLATPERQRLRRAIAMQAFTLADELDHPALAVEARAQHMAARIAVGEPCEDDAAHIAAIASAARAPLLQLPALEWYIGHAIARLDLARARELTQQAFALTQRKNPITATLNAALVDLTVRTLTGTLGGFPALLQSTAQADPENHAPRVTLLAMHLSSGDLAATRALLDELMSRFSSMRDHLDWLSFLSVCARASARVGHVDHARTLRAAYLEYEDVFVCAGDVLVWLGPAAYDLALLAHCLRDAAEAERLFGKAEELCKRLGALGPLLVVQTDRAYSAAQRGQRVEDALGRLCALRERAQGLGYVAQVREVDAMMRSAIAQRATQRVRGKA